MNAIKEEKDQPLIIGVGELLWDLLPAGRQLGGAPANFAYHAQALGAEAFVLSRVGDDALGREILDRFSGLGLRTDWITGSALLVGSEFVSRPGSKLIP